MRKALTVGILLTIMMVLPTITNNVKPSSSSAESAIPSPTFDYLTSSANGTGTSRSIDVYFSRTISSQQLSLSNTYADPNHHNFSLDLTQYHLAGWDLYRADISVSNIVAALEREVVGVGGTDTGFQIREVIPPGDIFIEELAQGFYNQPHNGSLHNYSYYYRSSLLDAPETYGYAFATIRNQYNVSSTNITASVNVTHSAIDTWSTVSGEDVILNASTYYWAMIDGTNLVKDVVYPFIIWWAEDTAGSYPAHLFLNSWTLNRPNMAVFNYTYTPWDTSSNNALQYTDPTHIDLQANSSGLSAFDWSWTAGSGNLKSVFFEGNQSIDVNYTLTLWYHMSSTASAIWDVASSSDPISWNATAALTYPDFIEPSSNYMTMTVPADWTPNGLYNSTSPSVDHGNYVDFGGSVQCSSLTNGTWTLTLSSFNYLTTLDLGDSSSGADISGEIDIETTIEMNATVEDELGTPSSTGVTNLTVWYEGAVIYAPAEDILSGGLSQFTWDIDTTTSNSGVYTIEVFWSDGQEAGYITEDIFVYFPTTFAASETYLEAFSDGSFDIRVHYNETFTPKGVNQSYGNVTYSYDGGANTSLSDLGNGTWTALIPSGGKIPNLYSVVVYAEGYGLENLTLTIDVLLTYDTNPLTWEWSGPLSNNISYLQSTNLTVYYNRTNGVNVSGAMVNVTIGPDTWPLQWDPVNESYWIQFNGSDFTGLPRTFNLTVNAWGTGHEPQYNDTLQLIVTEELTTSLSVTWYPSNLNITYIERLRIVANYSSEGSSLVGATVRLTFNGSSPVILTYNATDELWYGLVEGSIIDVGTWDLSLWAHLNGYSPLIDVQTLYVVEDTPQTTISWPLSATTIDYDDTVDLSITYTDSIGSPITDGNLTAVLLNVSYSMVHTVNGVYTVTFNPAAVKGLHEVEVFLIRHGYQSLVRRLNLTILATTALQCVSPASAVHSEYEQEYLTITVRLIDTNLSDVITDADVILTINGVHHLMTDSDGTYSVEILLDLTPTTYVVNIRATADFCVEATTQISLEVLTKRTVSILFSEQFLAIESVVERGTLPIDIILWDNSTDTPFAGEDVIIKVEVSYLNDTIRIENNTVTTNAQGEASWAVLIHHGGDVPATGIIITIQFERQRDKWNTQRIRTDIRVTRSAVDEVLRFFSSDIGIMAILAMFFLAVVAVGYRKGIKPKRIARRMSLEEQLLAFQDLDALKHFMAVYRGRGTCVFYHPFGKERIQADLISGFISAVTTVYGEIKGDGVQGTLEEIQYHGLRLNSYSGKYVVGILIIEGEMSTLLRQRLQWFVEMFEHQYDDELDGWVGVTDCFDTEWVVSNLHEAFNYYWVLPQKLIPGRKLKRNDRKYIHCLREHLDVHNEFEIEEVLEAFAKKFSMTQAEALDILLSLQEKEFIRPISIGTVLQRQGLGLAGDDEEGIGMDMFPGIGGITPTPEPEPVVEEPVEEFAEEPELDELTPVEEPAPEIPTEVGEEPIEEIILEEPIEEEEVVELPAEEEVIPQSAPEIIEEKFTIGEFVEKSEPVVEEEKGPSAEEMFVADVEALIKKRDDPDQQEQFLADVEALLKKEKIEEDEEES